MFQQFFAKGKILIKAQTHFPRKWCSYKVRASGSNQNYSVEILKSSVCMCVCVSSERVPNGLGPAPPSTSNRSLPPPSTYLPPPHTPPTKTITTPPCLVYCIQIEHNTKTHSHKNKMFGIFSQSL